MRSYFFLFFICYCSTSIQVFSQCTHPDYNALAALYNATEGDNWNEPWDLSDCDVCQWPNLDCSNGRVISLYLGGNNLNGSLPAEIGELEFLTHLYMSINNLNGTIPVELSQLSAIKLITLKFNQLTGCIPPEIGSLSTLNVFEANNNNLSGCFPEQLLNLCDAFSITFYNNPGLPNGGDFDAFCNGDIPPCQQDLTCPTDFEAWRVTSNSWTSNPVFTDGFKLIDLPNTGGCPNTTYQVKIQYYVNVISDFYISNDYLAYGPAVIYDNLSPINGNLSYENYNDGTLTYSLGNLPFGEGLNPKEYGYRIRITSPNSMDTCILQMCGLSLGTPSDTQHSPSYFCNFIGDFFGEQDAFSESGGIGIAAEAFSSFTLSPNPATHNFTLKYAPLPKGQPTNLILLNPQGQAILQKELHPDAQTASFNIHNLPSGLYLLQIQQQGRLLFTERLVVQ